jgi:hypothetical protein
MLIKVLNTLFHLRHGSRDELHGLNSMSAFIVDRVLQLAVCPREFLERPGHVWFATVVTRYTKSLLVGSDVRRWCRRLGTLLMCARPLGIRDALFYSRYGLLKQWHRRCAMSALIGGGVLQLLLCVPQMFQGCRHVRLILLSVLSRRTAILGVHTRGRESKSENHYQ